MILRSYKMTHDTGFAPNVYGNTLSLATCKWGIRHSCNVGEWIAGFSSQVVNGKAVVEKRLIYLAKVSREMNFCEFWKNYECKRPDKDKNGDNIYKPKANGEYEQMPNAHHGIEWKEHDLKADRVLLCDEFYYFGVGSALDLGNLLTKINVPQKQAPYGYKTYDIEIADTDNQKSAVQKLIDFVRANKDKCAKFKDEKGKVGGKGIVHQGGGSCGSAVNANQNSSCGSVAGNAGSCGGTSNGAC